jgi:outer membrane receptor protein involved in Fe transport
MLLLIASVAAAAGFANRRVSDVLGDLRRAGFVFIYSTHVLPANLRVEAEPVANEGIELAREILSQHGLVLIEAAPKVYSIARSPMLPSVLSPEPPRTTQVEEVIVQTSRYMLDSDYFANATFLTQDQLQNLPQFAGEALRSVQRLPGSATNGFSSVGPVRGGEPGETAIILDGLRLYEPFHLKNFLSPVSLLDARLIEGIEFYSGGFPAIYGDRMSAIVDARSVRPGAPRYYELGLNVFHASALGSTEFNDGQGHLLLSARRSNLGDLVQFSENDFGEPNYEDGFGRVDYDFTERTHGTFELLVSSDAIKALGAKETQRVRAGYRNVYAWATLEHEWSDAVESRVIVSYTDLANSRRGNIDEVGRTASVNDVRNFHVVGLRWENSLQTGYLQHRLGVEARRLWGEYRYVSDVSLSAGVPFPRSPALRIQQALSPEPQGYETLGYWDVRADLSTHLTFQGGVRIDTQTYDGTGDGEQWSPRLSVVYALADQSHLRASWGRFHQAQGINELQVEDGLDRFHPAQRADHFIVGFDHGFARGFDLRIEAYHKRYRRLNPRFENMFDPLVLFPESEFDRVMIDPASARAYGVEALLRLRRIEGWSGWLSYTWSQVEDRIDGQDVPRSWDQRHAVNLGVVWSKGPWTASLTNSYHAGWPTTELALDPTSEVPRVSSAVRNRADFDAFNSLDARLTRAFTLSRGVLDVFLEVTNATSRENSCCVEYESIAESNGTLTYSRDVDSWLPLVPSAGVLWRY